MRGEGGSMIHIPGGVLVAVEGIDGAGKTSVAAMLAQFCGERGIACTLSKEPTSLKWGMELRRSASEGRLTLERETELFELDRREHIERSILPALQEGNIVILDRYFWSNVAYQGGRGGDFENILARNESFAPVPDLVMLLDVDAELGIGRIRKRGEDPNLFEGLESLEKARRIFLQLASSHRKSLVLEAGEPLKTVGAKAILAFQALIVEKIAHSDSMNPDMVNKVMALLGGDLSSERTS
jgi:dTMP kinase